MAKTRATILDISSKVRYDIIRASMSQYNKAIESEFYFEATTLIESLICDRLESRLGELTKADVTFKTLGGLKKELLKMETDGTLKALVDINVKAWADKRNTTVHEAAKIDVDNPRTWEEVVKDAKDCAVEGRKLFDEYNKRLSQLRRLEISNK